MPAFSPVLATRLLALLVTFALAAAGCGGEAAPTSPPPPTQPLNPARPTATATTLIPTATLTLPPAAGDLARTATAQAPTPDRTEQARATLRQLALDTVSEAEGLSPSALQVVAVTGVRAGRDIEGCGRARAGMALASVRRDGQITEVLIDGDVPTICGTVSLYDDRPALFLTLDPIAADLTALAVERAARSAGVEADTVVVDSVRPMEWAGTTVGCDAPPTPEPGGSGVAGYRIAVTAGEDNFVYHTDFDRIIPCGQS